MNTRSSRRWWVLGAISIAVLAITLDVTVLNLALPTLSSALHATESQLQWFVTAYTLVLAAAMLPMGFLGDRYGRKAILVGGLILFAAGSFGCAYSTVPWFFIASRVVLAISGAAIIVVALSMVTVLFAKEERPRAIGIWSAANFLGLPLGPIVGGAILAHAWWGWIFLMNVPIAVVALVAVAVLVPESRAADAPRTDFIGLILSSIGLVAFMYGTIKAGEHGWFTATTLVPCILGIVALVAFGYWERGLSGKEGVQPLVDLALFRTRSFTWGVILTSLGGLVLFGILFTLPQYLQAVRGFDAEATGFRLLPAVFGLVAGAVPSDRIGTRIGVKATVTIGMVIAGVGSFLGTTTAATSAGWFIALWTFVVGAGCGLAFACAASSAMVEVSEERSGVGSGLLQAIVKVGPAFGASIIGSILNGGYRQAIDAAHVPAETAVALKSSVFAGLAVAQKLSSTQLLHTVRNAFLQGMDDAMIAAVAVAVAATVLALLFASSRNLSVSQARSGGPM